MPASRARASCEIPLAFLASRMRSPSCFSEDGFLNRFDLHSSVDFTATGYSHHWGLRDGRNLWSIRRHMKAVQSSIWSLCCGALVVASALVSSGCAGTYFTWAKARQVQPGMTLTEAEQILGRPNSVTSVAGNQRVMWVYGTAWGQSAAYSVTVKDGKIVEVPPIPDSFR